MIPLVAAVPLPLIGVGFPTSPPEPTAVDVTVHLEQPAEAPFIDAAPYGPPRYVQSWEDYVGQESVKRELEVYLDEAIATCGVMPHTLLASGVAGTGKTTLARLIADELGVRCVMLVPPFSAAALHQAALGMNDGEVLFIDEIHKLADHGPRAAENLLHLMEDGVLYLDDGVRPLAEFCLVGATTDPGKLPETIIDRFVIKPHFEPYTAEHMVRIVKNFCNYYSFQLQPETMVAIAKASRGTPRVARELVRAAKALQTSTGEPVGPEQLLAFKRFEPDGTTPQHRAYLTALYRLFGRDSEHGREYIAGEAAMLSLLRESKTGLARLERFLLERGLIDRTPRGRRLTDRGVLAAYNYARQTD